MIKLNKFGERLAYYLSVKGWSQQRLATELKTTQQTVSRWINGAAEPNIDNILLICHYLEEDPTELLGFNEFIENNFE